MNTETCLCRSCGGNGLMPVLSLGKTPLANSLLTKEQLSVSEAAYPLELAFCPACSLVQITQTVPPEKMFREYVYFSSFSETMLAHARQAAGKLITQRRLGGQSLVIEIASNDGYFLKNFVEAGIRVLGIDPADNVAQVAERNGVKTLCDFFGAELARNLVHQGSNADLILANNVMAHVPDINGVVGGIGMLLKPEGMFVMETPYVRDLVENLEFDTIYHEHVFYHSLTALKHLLERHGLVLADAERIAIHGGSLRVSAVRQDNPRGEANLTEPAQALLAEEESLGLTRPEFYRNFAVNVGELRGKVVSLLKQIKAQGKRIAAYGASAKGSTLMNYFGIGGNLLDFVVDRSTAKQGLYCPGTHLPILAPETLLKERPDYVLLLTWNFAEEIMAQQAEYRRGGGRFVIPLPEPRIV